MNLADSAYARDFRIQFAREGWPEGHLASIPDTVDTGNDRVVALTEAGRVLVVGATNPAATLTDPGDRYNQRPWAFATLDEAIAAVVGEPMQSELTVEELAAARALGMPVGYGIECRVLLRRHLDTDAPLDAVAWVVWQGGFVELHSWPWDAEGLAAAGVWAVEHNAVGRDGYPIRDPNELLVHIGAQ